MKAGWVKIRLSKGVNFGLSFRMSGGGTGSSISKIGYHKHLLSSITKDSLESSPNSRFDCSR